MYRAEPQTTLYVLALPRFSEAGVILFFNKEAKGDTVRLTAPDKLDKSS